MSDSENLPQNGVITDLQHYAGRTPKAMPYAFVPKSLLVKAAEEIGCLEQACETFKELKVKHINGDFENGRADVTVLLEPHPLMAILVESLRKFVGEAPNYQAVEVNYGTPGDVFVVTVVRPNGKRPEQRNAELMGYLDDIIDGVDVDALSDKAKLARNMYIASRPLPNCNAHLKATTE